MLSDGCCRHTPSRTYTHIVFRTYLSLEPPVMSEFFFGTYIKIPAHNRFLPDPVQSSFIILPPYFTRRYILYINSQYAGKPLGKCTPGRPRMRWVDNFKMDILEIGCGNRKWMKLV
jgi:hypothetical protein